jgi:Ca2+-binding RTX toxin-like protein
MPTTIAIESKDVKFAGVNTSYQHLYLVKTVTDESGRVTDERVIRGSFSSDGTVVTTANAPLARSADARRSETPAQRHHTVIDLEGRDPEAVWAVMVRHAHNIEAANLPYGTGVGGIGDPDEVNSNTVVGSVLHAVGVSLARNFPDGVSRSEAPLYNRLSAMDVNDRLAGGEGDDLVAGGAGNDRLSGRAGDDRLSGEAENDQLDGGAGQDVLVGGAGSDRFVFSSAADSPVAEPDLVVDFRRGIDTLDLRAVDADLQADGDQRFTFIGDREFSGKPGEVRLSGSLLEADQTGDGTADFAIAFGKSVSLSASDFLL